MRSAINRNLAGVRLQGNRHGHPRICYEKKIRKNWNHSYLPEYPVESIYKGRKSRDK